MWTQEKVNELRRLAALGLSSVEIATQLGEGFTKNSVIGKCGRLGIPLDGGKQFNKWSRERTRLLIEMEGQTSVVIAEALNRLPGQFLTDGAVRSRASMMKISLGGGNDAQRERARKASEIAQALAAKRLAEREKRIAASYNGHGVRLVDIAYDQCRWPLGDPHDVEGFRFCGAAAREGSAYCVSHHALAYVKPVKKPVKKPEDRHLTPSRVNNLA